MGANIKGKRWYKDLQDFVQTLEREGELLRIKAPVSPYLEITEITDVMCKSPGGGKALLFENVEGSLFPVLTNAFGSERRVCIALGVSHMDEIAKRLATFTSPSLPGSLKELLSLAIMGHKITKFIPRKYRGGTAPCQEVCHIGRDADLRRLPVLTCWPKDGGPFITLPVVITKSLEAGKRNAGMYRLQVYDSQTTGMHWHIHKDGSHYFQEYCRLGTKMPVAVAIGADPATIYAATAPLPRGMDEIFFAGFIREKPVPMVKCLTVDLEVPATSEFIIEGYVNPHEARIEGPFGDHTGYYSLAAEYPVFHITAITHKKHPMYASTVVGRPPMEDCYLAKATERIFLPLLRMVFPEIVDYWMPWEGVFHNITIISINKAYPRHAHKIMQAMWSQGQMSFCKCIVVVDLDIRVNDARTLITHLLNIIDFDHDLILTEGILDVLDHSAPQPLFGSKLGIDATRKMEYEPERTLQRKAIPFPSEASIRQAFSDIDSRFTDFFIPLLDTLHRPILVNLHKDHTLPSRSLAQVLLEHPDLEFFSVFAIFDHHIDLRDMSLIFWKLFNNVDPLRDIIIRDGRVVIDATKKGHQDGHHRPWPDDIIMTSEVKERVRRRASELGIEEFLNS